MYFYFKTKKNMWYLGVINRSCYLTWDVSNLVLGGGLIKRNSHSYYDVSQVRVFLHKPQLLLIIALAQVCLSCRFFYATKIELYNTVILFTCAFGTKWAAIIFVKVSRSSALPHTYSCRQSKCGFGAREILYVR